MPFRVLHIILLFTLVVRSAFAPATLLFYVVDEAQFVEYLCVNVDDPALHCKGKCQFKKIGDFYEHQHHESHTEVVYSSLVWDVPQLIEFDFSILWAESIQHQFNYLNSYQFIGFSSDFKPPVV